MDSGGGTAVMTRRSARLPARGGEAAGGASPADAGAAAAAAAAALPRGFPALPEVLLKPLDPSSIHVLVVGDLGTDEATGESVVEVLRASYRVTHASGDVDALALLRGVPTLPVDLILKEHEPPATDGVKFIYRVLKHQALRHIPIVVVSTRDDKVQVADCLHCGAADYLVKPLRRNELGTMWAHVWRRWVGVQLSAAQAQAAGLHPAALGGRMAPPRAAEGSGEGSGSGDDESSGQGSHDAEAARPAPDAPAPDARAGALPARPAAVVGALLPTLDGTLFASRAGAAPAEAMDVAPSGGAAPALPPAPGKSAFLAYSTPAKRAASATEPECRPWPQDPSMAAAAAAASLAAAAGLGQPSMALHPLAAAGAPFGLPFGLPPAFALFSADCLPPAAAAQAVAAQAAAAAAATAYGLRPSAAGREASGGATAVSGGATGGSGSDDASMDPLSAKARRAAALKKFQAKRASRCFTKKIRYTSRKQLAEARPRNRGQFVRVKKDADEPGDEDGAALLALAGCNGASAAAAAAAGAPKV